MIYRFISCLPVLTGLVAAQPAIAAEFVPHEARYRLTLQDLRLEGWSEEASGNLEVRLARDCFHWAHDRQLTFNIRFTDGRQTRLHMVERSRESLTGKKFWFWNRTTVNGETVAIVTGIAERPKKDEMVPVEPPEKKPDTTVPTVGAKLTNPANAQENPAKPPAPANGEAAKQAEVPKRPLGVKIVYSWPSEEEIELAPDVIFPMAALAEQIDSLAAGSMLARQPIFDGLRRQGGVRATYAPVQAKPVSVAGLADGDSKLLEARAWRYMVRYLPLEDSDKAKPLRTVTQRVHANGIVSDMILDFGPFSVKGDIAWVKELQTPKCE